MCGKAIIREKFKKERGGFIGSVREKADKKIFDLFFDKFSGYGSFFIYNSFSDEADTSAIIAKLLSIGKNVYLPRIENGKMVPVPYGETVKGAFGVYEPVGQAFCGGIDVTVVPLLAINGRGFRVGYGKGFYDGYLKNSETVKAGIGYAFQFAEFKEDGWDVPLDIFLCEKGIYGFGKFDVER